MEMDLTPKKAEAMFEGDGGSYCLWSSSKVPLLAKNNVAAGFLKLQPQEFALPHYSDAYEIGSVIQGTDGTVGMLLPNTDKEVVLKIKKGDIIPVPLGTVQWWFNNGDSELIVSFFGETSQGHVPGQITYFLLTGTQGIMGGFSSEVITKAYNLTTNEAKRLTKSQQGVLIVKLKKGQHKIPEPQIDKTKEMVFNIDAAKSDHGGVENGGLVKTLAESEFPFLGQVGLSVMRVKLEPNSLKAPMHLMKPEVQVFYVARGSGKIEIVGFNGESVLDSQVEAGHLIVVPKFFVSAKIAGEHGMEFYSILTTKRPMFEESAGKSSMWKAISPQVLEVALNVDSDFVKFFLSHLDHTTNLLPPSN